MSAIKYFVKRYKYYLLLLFVIVIIVNIVSITNYKIGIDTELRFTMTNKENLNKFIVKGRFGISLLICLFNTFDLLNPQIIRLVSVINIFVSFGLLLFIISEANDDLFSQHTVLIVLGFALGITFISFEYALYFYNQAVEITFGYILVFTAILFTQKSKIKFDIFAIVLWGCGQKVGLTST